jgi:hypothetical protein
MAVKVLAQKEEQPRCAIADGSPEVVVIAHAADRLHDAHEVMQHDGARYFLEEISAVCPLPTRLAATS